MQTYLQPVRRIFRPEAVLLPRELPIQPVWLFLGIGFFGKNIPTLQIYSQFRRQVILRGGFFGGALQRRPGPRLLNFVVIAADLSSRTHPYADLFLLLRANEAHLPIPPGPLR